jgi:hypothetical protein
LDKGLIMPLTLKEEVLQMVAALEDENALAMIKAEIEYINNKGELDVFSELSAGDKAELMELINEPGEKDTISHNEYLKATARWRTS